MTFKSLILSADFADIRAMKAFINFVMEHVVKLEVVQSSNWYNFTEHN